MSDVVLKTIIAEAGGDPKAMAAVASVIHNRAVKEGKTPEQIVKAHGQFEGYSNPGPKSKQAQKDPAVVARAADMWNGVKAGTIADPTNGATMYHASSISPYWAKSENKHGTVNIGGNVFYKGSKALDAINAAAPSPQSRPSALAYASTAKAPVVPVTPGTPASGFNTVLSPKLEGIYQRWKAQAAPNDSGNDYDFRGAFASGISPAANGHWPDTFKKPTEPTFSVESQYAKYAPTMAGRWNGDTYIPRAASLEARDELSPPPLPHISGNLQGLSQAAMNGVGPLPGKVDLQPMTPGQDYALPGQTIYSRPDYASLVAPRAGAQVQPPSFRASATGGMSAGAAGNGSSALMPQLPRPRPSAPLTSHSVQTVHIGNDGNPISDLQFALNNYAANRADPSNPANAPKVASVPKASTPLTGSYVQGPVQVASNPFGGASSSGSASGATRVAAYVPGPYSPPKTQERLPQGIQPGMAYGPAAVDPASVAAINAAVQMPRPRPASPSNPFGGAAIGGSAGYLHPAMLAPPVAQVDPWASVRYGVPAVPTPGMVTGPITQPGAAPHPGGLLGILGGLFGGGNAAPKAPGFNGKTSITSNELAGANQGFGGTNALMPDSTNSSRWLTGY